MTIFDTWLTWYRSKKHTNYLRIQQKGWTDRPWIAAPSSEASKQLNTISFFLFYFCPGMWYSVWSKNLSVHGDFRHALMPFWLILNSQLFRRFGLSENIPDANACWSHKSNSSSSIIISASSPHGYPDVLDRSPILSKPTMFTWKVGPWVFALHSIPFMQPICKSKKTKMTIKFTYDSC